MAQVIWEVQDFPQDKVHVTKRRTPKNPKELRESIYLATVGPQQLDLPGVDCSKIVTHKTCPNCSAVAGRFVWHTMDTYHFRVMRGGKLLPQSWCEDCRRNERKQQAKRRS